MSMKLVTKIIQKKLLNVNLTFNNLTHPSQLISLTHGKHKQNTEKVFPTRGNARRGLFLCRVIPVSWRCLYQTSRSGIWHSDRNTPNSNTTSTQVLQKKSWLIIVRSNKQPLSVIGQLTGASSNINLRGLSSNQCNDVMAHDVNS